MYSLTRTPESEIVASTWQSDINSVYRLAEEPRAIILVACSKCVLAAVKRGKQALEFDPLVGYAALLISLQAGHARRAEARAHEDKVDDRTAHECSFSLGNFDTRRLPEPRAVSGSEQRCIPDAVGRPRKNCTVAWSRLTVLVVPAFSSASRAAIVASCCGLAPSTASCDCGCRPPCPPPTGAQPTHF